MITPIKSLKIWDLMKEVQMRAEMIVLSTLIFILSGVVIYLAYALFKEQSKSSKYLTNFLEIWRKQYQDQTQEIVEENERRE